MSRSDGVKKPLLLALALLVVALGYLYVLAIRQGEDVSTAKDDASSASSRAESAEGVAKQAKDQANVLAKQLERSGQKPVVDPSTLPDLNDPTLPQITQSQANVAFASYCLSSPARCKLGIPITQADLVDALSSLCSRTGKCVGKPGEPGPAPEPGQIAGVLLNLCSSGRITCKGDAGSNGTDGADGKDGRGITSTRVTEACHFVVAFSDGTETDLGPICGADGATGDRGPQGPAGPVCPEAYHPDTVTVLTNGGPQEIYTCLPDPEPTPANP